MKAAIFLAALVAILVVWDSEASLFGHKKKNNLPAQQVITNYVPVGQNGAQYGIQEPVGYYGGSHGGHHGGHHVGSHHAGGHHAGVHGAHHGVSSGGGAASASASASAGGAASASASAAPASVYSEPAHQHYSEPASHYYEPAHQHYESVQHHGQPAVYGINAAPHTLYNQAPAALCQQPPCYGGLVQNFNSPVPAKKHGLLGFLHKNKHGAAHGGVAHGVQPGYIQPY